MTLARWWVELSNKVHADEFHWLAGCTEMEFLKFNSFHFEFFTDSTVLTMTENIFLHIVPIVQSSYRQIDLLEHVITC